MKSFTKSRTIQPFAAWSAMLALAACASTALAQDAIERSFEVREGGRIAVDVSSADVRITAWERPEAAFSAVNADDLEFEFSQDDDTLTIRTRNEDRRGLFGWRSGKSRAKITIHSPLRQDLRLRTSGGDIEVDQLAGELHARTSGGDVAAGAIEGPAELRTSGGTIRLQGATGPVEAKTSGGSIRIESASDAVEASTSGGSIRIGAADGAVNAKTSGGSIHIEAASGAVQARTSGGSVEVHLVGQPAADSELRTSGGSVTVHLRENIEATLSARASGGRVNSDFPDANPENSVGSGKLEQSLNGGGPLVKLRTSGGSIRIRRIEQ